MHETAAHDKEISIWIQIFKIYNQFIHLSHNLASNSVVTPTQTRSYSRNSSPCRKEGERARFRRRKSRISSFPITFFPAELYASLAVHRKTGRGCFIGWEWRDPRNFLRGSREEKTTWRKSSSVKLSRGDIFHPLPLKEKGKIRIFSALPFTFPLFFFSWMSV